MTPTEAPRCTIEDPPGAHHPQDGPPRDTRRDGSEEEVRRASRGTSRHEPSLGADDSDATAACSPPRAVSQVSAPFRGCVCELAMVRGGRLVRGVPEARRVSRPTRALRDPGTTCWSRLCAGSSGSAHLACGCQLDTLLMLGTGQCGAAAPRMACRVRPARLRRCSAAEKARRASVRVLRVHRMHL